ncbi:MAG: hypothetical protein IJK93_10570 [Muribaculaceae bacterium]|nr:hypothetical protein [Muribaculaceae bacterium]
MKKILFSLVALISVMTVQAQSICATWRSMQPIVETAEDGTFEAQNIIYTFNEDGTYSFVDEVTEASQPAPTMAMEIAMSIEVKGTYVLEGDQLKLTPNLDTYKAELISVSMNGKVTSNPMVTSQVNEMLNSAEFKAQFGEVETNTVKVSDSMLEMNDGEQTLTFVRFATIAN